MKLILTIILGIGILLMISFGFYTLFTEKTQKESLIRKIKNLAEEGKKKKNRKKLKR